MYSNDLICDILKYIDNNLNSKITIEDLEKKFFYNKFYIIKLFKKEINMTIIEYINNLRIYNSISQIRDTNNNLLNIAFKNGFYSIEYFSETFKKFVGVNPQIAKNFFKKKNKTTTKQEKIINESILKLYETKKYKEKYLLHKKPTVPQIKKLSIFK